MYVKWDPWSWIELREQLERRKIEAAKPRGVGELRSWEVNEMPVEVEATGARFGKGRKGPYYAFRLEHGGLTVFVQDRVAGDGRVPNVVMRANGEACLVEGADTCLKRGRGLVVALGGVVEREKLARVDICLDMPGADMRAFVQAYVEGRYICRAKSKSLAESSGATVKLGESPLLVRVYDKLAEARKKADPRRKLALIERRWGGVVPAQACRVEFEVRREALKKRGIDSVEDYYRKRADLVAYLTHEWVRFTAAAVDRDNKNQSRAEVWALWRDVQGALEAWAGSPRGESLAPLDLGKADVHQLFKQAFGSVTAAARFQGIGKMSAEEVMSYAMKGLQTVAVEVR